jgi:hypothetical protein
MTDLPHLRLEDGPQPIDYTSTQAGGGEFRLPPRDRSLHARKLKAELERARDQAEELWRRQNQDPQVLQRQAEGLVLTFRSDPEYDLKLESLELRRHGIELLSVASDDQGAMVAKVFVPEGELIRFIRRVEAYVTQSNPQRYLSA